jgi:hypothetical protein
VSEPVCIGEATLSFSYLEQPPARWTFDQPKLKEWVENWCIGRVLNLFAGKNRLLVNEFRVDISEEYHPDSICDAFDFVALTEEKFDTILLDPPYNLRKAREKYNGKYIGSLTKIKNELPRILKTGGRVITLGYDSVGMGNCRGFSKIACCLVCHFGDHNDTIGLVEKYIQPELQGIK